MSRVTADNRLTVTYDKGNVEGVLRGVCNQLNNLSEGRLDARYQAQASVPSNTSVNFAKGDITWDSNPTVRGSVAPGLAASYVRLGWVCVAPGSGATATFQEIRTLTGA